MSKKKTKVIKHTNLARAKEGIHSPYEVSWEPVIDRRFQNLPQNVQVELDELYKQLSREPGKSISRLLELKQEYPKLPLIYNYLSIAYGYVDKEKQYECIRENFEKNPGYLFARCNFAQLCIQQGEYEKIPEIFDRKYDLKALYPRRSRFHMAEYVSFAHVLCLYFNGIGEREQAESIYKGLQETVPDAIETKEVKQVLFPGFFRRLGKRALAVLEK